MTLEHLTSGTSVRGILPDGIVTVVNTEWFGSDVLELTYKTPTGTVRNQLLYRDDESDLEVVADARPWSFDGDGHRFRLVAEALRIRLAHLFDPVLAVHTSDVEPLPHQITAVYESMLPRHPLRYLLADDPGAGKTIMAGLLIKQMIARGDVQRCLIVCPGGLVEQWQDELYRRFQLPFDIMTNDKLDAAVSGNYFLENDLVIARLDKLARDESAQAKLRAQDGYWDLVVCDEAHKLSATYFGRKAKYTKRYRLGQLLAQVTRNFLLMTATPHNGKERDFHLFMALLDQDRFEGQYRKGVHSTDASDLMRRMVKEDLLRFDGTRLFPERIAHTVPYQLSDPEAQLYRAVTTYVENEFNRAQALNNEKRRGTVGFALTILQRRLASSPEAIYQSLRRRRERLKDFRAEIEEARKAGIQFPVSSGPLPEWDEEYAEDIEDAPDQEYQATAEAVLGEATAARTIAELDAEIATLRTLEATARSVRQSAEDRKWQELAGLLGEIFTPELTTAAAEPPRPPYGSGPIAPHTASQDQKLVIFTEHRDTLSYVEKRITSYLGRADALVVIDGTVRRQDRLRAQEAFVHDPAVRILLATDAAGEGINLQRAHLMVNYDLPWNPNRLEQRFGRIHRIGQKEVCHLWNLIATNTREGKVYRRLLEKLETARHALGGKVFDVLGKLQFEGKPLRDLLIEAVRYGEREDVKARQTQVVDHALDLDNIRAMLEDESLTPDVMNTSRIFKIREEMERAEARKLQPHFIELFFREAFKRLGGRAKERETRRFEVTFVPALIRNHDRSSRSREPVVTRYQRITFEKPLIAPDGEPRAALICPGHPLLDTVIDLTLDRDRELLKRGATLVDEKDFGTSPRILFFLEHSITDSAVSDGAESRTISQRMLYVEVGEDGAMRELSHAPYLDYRPLRDGEPGVAEIAARPEMQWIGAGLEREVLRYAVANVVADHLKKVRAQRLPLIAKTEVAVKERLTKEIMYWDRRATQLSQKERAGKPNARLNSQEARKRADELQVRLASRLERLKQERKIAAMSPVVMGGLLVVPAGLLAQLAGNQLPEPQAQVDKQAVAARAREIVMEVERSLGYDPADREFEKLGYDVESRVPGNGRLRFIEVKGRAADAQTITVTKNEILFSLNKPNSYMLAIVLFHEEDSHSVHYVRRPFSRALGFDEASSNFELAKLLQRAERPN